MPRVNSPTCPPTWFKHSLGCSWAGPATLACYAGFRLFSQIKLPQLIDHWVLSASISKADPRRPRPTYQYAQPSAHRFQTWVRRTKIAQGPVLLFVASPGPPDRLPGVLRLDTRSHLHIVSRLGWEGRRSLRAGRSYLWPPPGLPIAHLEYRG